MSKIFKLLTFPFELLGRLIATTAVRTWEFLGKFLLSPWGLIVPITLLVAIFLATQLDRFSEELAASYRSELEVCEESDISRLLEAIIGLDEKGISTLADALGSAREATFAACAEAIQNELQRWKTLSPAQRDRRYQLLSKALLDRAALFPPESQLSVIRLARQMLRDVVHEDQTASGSRSFMSGELSDSQQTIQNCERILSTIEAATKRSLNPNSPNHAPENSGLTRYHRRSFDPVLMAVSGAHYEAADSQTGLDGIPSVSNFDRKTEELAGHFRTNSLSSPRAEQLYAYHQSPLYREQLETPYRPAGTENPLENRVKPNAPATDLVATMSSVGKSFGTENTNTHLSLSTTPSVASPDRKFADQYEQEEKDLSELPEGGIARNYLERLPNKRPTDDNGETFLADVETPDAFDDFLTEELQRIRPDRIPSLSSAQLMRLLQHPEDRVVTEARKVLIGRDGFQEIHLKLAYRLYHPLPSVREEIVAMLPYTTGVKSEVWLDVLLDDPNADVRYRAASFSATSGDPTMQRKVIEKGRRDSDARIVSLAQQLAEKQRRGRR